MLLALATAQAVAAAGTSIVVESFDNPKHQWKSKNDPGLERLSIYDITVYTLEHTDHTHGKRQTVNSDGREIDVDNQDRQRFVNF